MITIARSFTRHLVAAALLGAALLIAAPAASARGDEAPRGTWMARPAAATEWGRLVLRDGALEFNSSSTSWLLVVSDIRRAAIESDRLVLESASGDNYNLTILDARLLPDSPRPVLKVIQKALQLPSARRESRIASAPIPRNRTDNK